MKKFDPYLLLIVIVIIASCKSKVKERKDEVYSRHLQKHIVLTVINTPVPNNKSDFNLLLLNDGQEIEKLRVKEIVDSLYRSKLIQPLIVVGIHAFDRKKEYGVAGNPDVNGNGTYAEKYQGFIRGELLPFVKKKAAVGRFHSVTLAGVDLGGLSAFDVAWDNADKFDKVGVFSGTFGIAGSDKNNSDSSAEDRILLNKIRSSRKRPHLQYWFYEAKNDSTKNDTKELIDLIKKKNFINAGDIAFSEDKNGSNDYDSWSHAFPQFLLWAEGK